MNEEKKIEHESFAVLQISRVSGEIKNLFGSSIQHQHFIELNIAPAYISRDLHRDWVGSHNTPYITIQMSNSQFAEAITSMNMGTGTPVTLKSMVTKDGYKKMEEPPQEDKRKEFDNEFEDDMKELYMELSTMKDKILTSLNGKVSKKVYVEVSNYIGKIEQEIRSNIPFIKKQFTEQMDKTTLEAKGEVEGFFLNKIHKLGLKGLKLDNILKVEDKIKSRKGTRLALSF